MRLKERRCNTPIHWAQIVLVTDVVRMTRCDVVTELGGVDRTASVQRPLLCAVVKAR